MKATPLFGLLLSLCLSSVSSSDANQCQRRVVDLPVKHAGEKLPPSTDNDGTSSCLVDGALQQAALERLNSNVDTLIDLVLPELQDYLSPSPCGGIGWTKVAFLDMKNTSYFCPNSLRVDQTDNKRTCRIPFSIPGGCRSVMFDTKNFQYNQVCGRVISYQYGPTEGFYRDNRLLSINDNFVDGVVITHGTSREHIWTFVAGLDETNVDTAFVCPCLRNATHKQVPSFVGTNYFCESGVADYPIDRYNAAVITLFREDPLWDGSGCGPDNDCCTHSFPPYFIAALDELSCDDIEVRVCIDGNTHNKNIHIEMIELYIK